LAPYLLAERVLRGTAGSERQRQTAGIHEYNLLTRSMTEPTVTEEPDLADLINLLDDEHVRSILTATSTEPLSAQELSDRCDVSASTIYRRVNRLKNADLLREQTRPRPDGHHDTVYVSTLTRFELTLEDGEMDWNIERRQRDIADELTRMWGKF